jgi:N-succinyldiaminopimelate aminotransferase
VTGSGGDDTAGPPTRPVLASRLRGFGVTIFAEMSMLAERTGSINLGQGFPDSDDRR